MNNFYLFLWLRWLARVSICSVAMASAISLILTVFIYFISTSSTLDAEVLAALFDVFWFWFVILWNVTLLLALFRSIKYIFNTCIKGYELKLLECESKEIIDIIGYGDLVKVWRKWFMLLIWLVASMMIVSLIFTYIFTDFTSIFEWFNIFYLYALVIISGYFSFILMVAKCKRIEIRKC